MPKISASLIFACAAMFTTPLTAHAAVLADYGPGRVAVVRTVHPYAYGYRRYPYGYGSPCCNRVVVAVRPVVRVPIARPPIVVYRAPGGVWRP
jgi:hypothetical protein